MTKTLTDPVTGVSVTVPDDLVDRFVAAGYGGGISEEGDVLEALSFSELKELASEEEVDLKGVKSKKAAIAAILEARLEPDEDDEEDDDEDDDEDDEEE